MIQPAYRGSLDSDVRPIGSTAAARRVVIVVVLLRAQARSQQLVDANCSAGNSEGDPDGDTNKSSTSSIGVRVYIGKKDAHA
jgi:hypothetical protein